jgi:hypothetical protein
MEKEMNAGLSETKSGQADHTKRSEQMKGSPSEDLQPRTGTVLRVDGDTYFMKWQEGKYGCLHTDYITQNTRAIKQGDCIEATIDANNHALLLRLIAHS